MNRKASFSMIGKAAITILIIVVLGVLIAKLVIKPIMAQKDCPEVYCWTGGCPGLDVVDQKYLRADSMECKDKTLSCCTPASDLMGRNPPAVQEGTGKKPEEIIIPNAEIIKPVDMPVISIFLNDDVQELASLSAQQLEIPKTYKFRITMQNIGKGSCEVIMLDSASTKMSSTEGGWFQQTGTCPGEVTLTLTPNDYAMHGQKYTIRAIIKDEKQKQIASKSIPIVLAMPPSGYLINP